MVWHWKKYLGGGAGIWITDINPTSSGIVGDKVYESAPSDSVLETCKSDTANVTVTFMADGAYSGEYAPTVDVNGVPCTNIVESASDARIFTGTVDITLVDIGNGTAIVTAHSSSGHSHTVIVELVMDGPDVIDVDLTKGVMPLLPNPEFAVGMRQTHLKEDDVYYIEALVENDAVLCEVDAFGAAKAGTLALGIPDSGGPGYRLCSGNIFASDQTGNLAVRVKARNAFGTYGASFTSTDTLPLIQETAPIGAFSITYPIGQAALKGSETADVEATVTNFIQGTDFIEYISVDSTLDIPLTDTYQLTKTVQRIAGDYVDTNNYRIRTILRSNGAAEVRNTNVKIANVAPTIDITTLTSRLVSGGNDGTSAQDHPITITSDQDLAVAPILQAPAGTFQGGGFTGGPTVWVRDLQVHDDDPRGTHTFFGLIATNEAGITQTVINSGADYVIGGFVARDIVVMPFATEAEVGVKVLDFAKYKTGEWSFLGYALTKNPIGTSAPVVDGYTIDSLGVQPHKLQILDTAAAAASTQASIISGVEEEA